MDKAFDAVNSDYRICNISPNTLHLVHIDEAGIDNRADYPYSHCSYEF